MLYRLSNECVLTIVRNGENVVCTRNGARARETNVKPTSSKHARHRSSYEDLQVTYPPPPSRRLRHGQGLV
jgi:hypothetical protein